MSNKNGQSGVPTDGYARADGWFNALSGHGDINRSKSESSEFRLDLLDDQTVADLWRGDDLAARVIEDLPGESFRPGFRINLDDKEQSEQAIARAEELCVSPIFIEAKEKERAFGGAAIYPIINDGNGDLSEPLNLDRISEVEHLMVLEPRELQVNTWYADIRQPKFGRPETYLLQPTSQGVSPAANERIHESRLILFYGLQVSRSQASVRTGWGDSVMNRVWRVLRDYNISWGSVSELLNDFAQAVFSIKGLAELIAQDKDEIIKARIRAVQLSRSTIRATMMDSEETFERKQTPVSGMPELLDRFNTRLAAAADMPVTRLMGQSPAGLNATGESDIRFYYDRIAADRTRRTQKQLEEMVRLILLEKSGATKTEPKNWSVVFNPLWQPSQLEEVQARTGQATTDQIYIQEQVISPEEVAIARFGGDQYSHDLQIDIAEREKLTKELEENQPGDEALTAEMGMDKKGAKEGATGEVKVADAAMNGSQIKSLMDIVGKVAAGEISRESGIALIQVAFPTVDKKEAEAVLGPKNFEPKKADLPAGFPPGVGSKPTFLPKDDDPAQIVEERAGKIEQRGRKWVALSTDGKKVLGTHSTEEAAKKQLRAIEASKGT